jgi:hypothetical protein
MQRTLASALAVLAATAGLSAGMQGGMPNLSGTWKMNLEKSKFERPGPTGITVTFDHKDPSITEKLTLTNDGTDRSVDVKYTTDGKETTQTVMGALTQTSAKWEGKALTLEWKADGGRLMRRTFTAAADGKSITMIVVQGGPNGTATDTVLLEKQAPAK